MTDSVPEGYVGNLTEEHEAKLKQLWGTVFKLYDLYESNDPELQAAIKSATDKANAPAKSRFGFFRGGSSSSEPENVVEKYLNMSATTDAGQQANRKKFVEMLAKYDSKTVRAMVIEAVKADHPDVLILRFLRARKWDVDAALVMMIFAMDWRCHTFKLESDIMWNGDTKMVENETSSDAHDKAIAKDFMKQLRIGKGYVHGTDRLGRPISCVRVRLHKPFAEKVEALERFIVYIIETARFTLRPPVETACLIFDMSGFTLANMDYVPLKFIIQCFEANYPESLGAILVHDAPWVFKTIWGAIRGMLDPVVAGKVHFTYGREGLEEFIEPSQLIKELGGDEDWDYEYVEPVDGENDLMKDTAAKEAVLAERDEIASRFEATTRKWMEASPGPENDKLQEERAKIAEESRVNYWKLDPYVRARSMYDRQGILTGGGPVNWYSYKDQHKGQNGSAKPAEANGAAA